MPSGSRSNSAISARPTAVSPSTRIVPGCASCTKYSQLLRNRSIPARISARLSNAMLACGISQTPSGVNSDANRS